MIRLCLVKDHQDSVISHLCLYKQCQNDSRWGCNLCLEKEFHKHRQQNNDHLMNTQQLIELLQLQNTDFKNVISQIKQDVYSLTRQQINRIINCHYQQYNQHPQKISQVEKEASQLSQQSRKTDINYTEYLQMDQKHLNYEVTQISPNYNFLVFSTNAELFIFDLITKQKIQTIQLKHFIISTLFSENQKYLYCGNHIGKLHCFKVNQNFKLISQQYICQPSRSHGYEYQTIIIKPSIILLFFNKKIQIINNKIKKQQQLINFFDKDICAFEYSQRYQLLICVQSGLNQDSFIKFIKIPTLQIIMEEKFQRARKIQLMSEDQLISIKRACDNLYLWKINYAQKQVTLLKTFESTQYIFNVQFFQSIDRIFLHNYNQFQILDSALQIVKIIKHDCSISTYKPQRLNYIILQNENSLRILKLQQEL